MKNSKIYFDSIETQPHEARVSNILKMLPEQISNAKKNSPYFKKHLINIEPMQINDTTSLLEIPITRKSDLINLQKQSYPFGGLTTCKPGKLKRIFQSPGPVYDPEGYGIDWWRTARAFYAAGFRKGEIVHNSFSYHLTPAGVMLETGAAKIGCAVVPAGVGNTKLQLQSISDIRPAGFAGTPSFLKILIEKALELNIDISSLSKSLVGGEALTPKLRLEIENAGINCQQIYASADLGCIAYESVSKDGLIVDEGLYVEIVRPGTNNPAADGDVGEVVVTSFCPEYPLIRFGTGDLSAIMPGESSCGRTNTRLRGWMGRADQTTKVKGMFVHPKQIQSVTLLNPEIIKSQLTVERKNDTDLMTLVCEVENYIELSQNSNYIKKIVDNIKSICKLRGEVKLIAPGSLPNNGKVIDDLRDYT